MTSCAFKIHKASGPGRGKPSLYDWRRWTELVEGSVSPQRVPNSERHASRNNTSPYQLRRTHAARFDVKIDSGITILSPLLEELCNSKVSSKTLLLHQPFAMNITNNVAKSIHVINVICNVFQENLISYIHISCYTVG